MKNEVLEFIHRRFPTDCNWISGNCFHFAVILHSVYKNSTIYYDVINGHFVTLIDGKYYDWTGIVDLVEWDNFEEYDSLQYKVIKRDCIN